MVSQESGRHAPLQALRPTQGSPRRAGRCRQETVDRARRAPPTRSRRLLTARLDALQCRSRQPRPKPPSLRPSSSRTQIVQRIHSLCCLAFEFLQAPRRGRPVARHGNTAAPAAGLSRSVLLGGALGLSGIAARCWFERGDVAVARQIAVGDPEYRYVESSQGPTTVISPPG